MEGGDLAPARATDDDSGHPEPSYGVDEYADWQAEDGTVTFCRDGALSIAMPKVISDPMAMAKTLFAAVAALELGT